MNYASFHWRDKNFSARAIYENQPGIKPWNREKAKTAIAVPCKVLLHQYVGDVNSGIFDFNQINPFLDNPELVLQRLILPPA